MICSFSCECFGTMHPFLRYTCASIMRSPVMSRRSSIGETVSRGIWSHAYQVQERSVDSGICRSGKGVESETYVESDRFVRVFSTCGVRRAAFWLAWARGARHEIAAVIGRPSTPPDQNAPPYRTTPHAVLRRTPIVLLNRLTLSRISPTAKAHSVSVSRHSSVIPMPFNRIPRRMPR